MVSSRDIIDVPVVRTYTDSVLRGTVVAVIGIYDKNQASEIPRAYVVPRDGLGKTEEDAKEIIDWLGSKVANHKKLRGGVRFVDEIPKSVSGKILRRLLKVKAQEEEEGIAKAKL